jgi:choline dehydrogenase-like flavoprotein
MPNNIFDAIVIGSGITGGWAAKELCEKGLKVIMLERGKNVEHVKDYVKKGGHPWEFAHRGGMPTTKMLDEYRIIQRDYPLNERNLDWWANEKDCPITEVKRFDWYRGYQVGGRSLMWGRQSYRWNQWDFEANAKDGVAIDWPIRYNDLAPWYSYVEKFAGIAGSKEGLAELPDGEFLPPMQMNVVEKDIAKRLREKYKNERHLIIGRNANLTVPHNNRTNCQYRNKCWMGCPFGGYFSTQSATLPAAVKTGNLTLRPFSIVTKIIYDKNIKKATGVEVLDAETNLTYTYNAKIIFVNASAFNSAWVLMNSATDVWENGLGSSSGELGHNVMDHHFKAGASGRVEGFEDRYYYGHRPNGVIIPRYQNIYNDKRNYLRGFMYQAGAERGNWFRNMAELSIGGDFKDALCEPGSWSFGMNAFGEMLPHHNNKISLDKTKKDKWGLPILKVDVALQENEKLMRQSMMDDAKEILEACGVKDVATFDNDYAPGMGIHEMGTARMGKNPKTSVLNAHNQVWDALNVFVTDGACMTSSSCVNPSLTYMALTARACDYAVSELKKQNL